MNTYYSTNRVKYKIIGFVHKDAIRDLSAKIITDLFSLKNPSIDKLKEFVETNILCNRRKDSREVQALSRHCLVELLINGGIEFGECGINIKEELTNVNLNGEAYDFILVLIEENYLEGSLKDSFIPTFCDHLSNKLLHSLTGDNLARADMLIHVHNDQCLDQIELDALKTKVTELKSDIKAVQDACRTKLKSLKNEALIQAKQNALDQEVQALKAQLSENIKQYGLRDALINYYLGQNLNQIELNELLDIYRYIFQDQPNHFKIEGDRHKIPRSVVLYKPSRISVDNRIYNKDECRIFFDTDTGICDFLLGLTNDEHKPQHHKYYMNQTKIKQKIDAFTLFQKEQRYDGDTEAVFLKSNHVVGAERADGVEDHEPPLAEALMEVHLKEMLELQQEFRGYTIDTQQHLDRVITKIVEIEGVKAVNYFKLTHWESLEDKIKNNEDCMTLIGNLDTKSRKKLLKLLCQRLAEKLGDKFPSLFFNFGNLSIVELRDIEEKPAEYTKELLKKIKSFLKSTNILNAPVSEAVIAFHIFTQFIEGDIQELNLYKEGSWATLEELFEKNKTNSLNNYIVSKTKDWEFTVRRLLLARLRLQYKQQGKIGHFPVSVITESGDIRPINQAEIDIEYPEVSEELLAEITRFLGKAPQVLDQAPQFQIPVVREVERGNNNRIKAVEPKNERQWWPTKTQWVLFIAFLGVLFQSRESILALVSINTVCRFTGYFGSGPQYTQQTGGNYTGRFVYDNDTWVPDGFGTETDGDSVTRVVFNKGERGFAIEYDTCGNPLTGLGSEIDLGKDVNDPTKQWTFRGEYNNGQFLNSGSHYVNSVLVYHSKVNDQLKPHGPGSLYQGETMQAVVFENGQIVSNEHSLFGLEKGAEKIKSNFTGIVSTLWPGTQNIQSTTEYKDGRIVNANLFNQHGIVTYAGETTNNREPHGYGERYDHDGITKTFVGHFKKGMRKKGTEYSKGEIAFVGKFENDKPKHGITFNPGRQPKYFGARDDRGRLHGKKCVDFDKSGNIIFTGKYQHGIRQGEGYFIFIPHEDVPLNYDDLCSFLDEKNYYRGRNWGERVFFNHGKRLP